MIWEITIREIEDVAAVREQRFAPDTSVSRARTATYGIAEVTSVVEYNLLTEIK
jgi:hypothetical protein